MLNGNPSTAGVTRSQRATEKQIPQKGIVAKRIDTIDGFFTRVSEDSWRHGDARAHLPRNTGIREGIAARAAAAGRTRPSGLPPKRRRPLIPH
jgi:hypothetical protein